MARPQPIADLLDLCLAPSLRARGFAESSIIAVWPEIVGSRLALFSRPLKIEWKKRRNAQEYEGHSEPATLVILVESAFALDLQHMAPTIIERINTHYGWRCVNNLVFKQGPVARPDRPVKKARILAPEEQERIQDAVKDIKDERLRNALAHLGEAVLASKK